MAINVNTANNQSIQLNNNIAQLHNAKKQLSAYKYAICNSWKGKETSYIITAIEQVIKELDSAIKNLDSLSNDIKTTAKQIKREEDAAAAAAAAARARALKQQLVSNAQSAYDEAVEELDELNDKREKLESKQKKASLWEFFLIQKELEELNEEINLAKKRVVHTYDNLKAAKR